MVSNQLLFVLLFAVCTSSATAQSPVAVGAKPTHIVYSHYLPKAASGLMPKGAKTLFWGTFNAKKGNEPMAIHFMRLKPESKTPDDERQLSLPYYSLDVFQKSNTRWQRITHAPLTDKTLIKEPDSLVFAANFYWIDKKEKIPLVTLSAFGIGDYGPIGKMVFLSFAGGWKSSPAIQAFRFGEWFDSDSIGQTNTVQIDKTGLAQILVKIFPASDSGPGELRFLWDAKRGKFWPDVPSQEIIKIPYPPYRELDEYLSTQ